MPGLHVDTGRRLRRQIVVTQGRLAADGIHVRNVGRALEAEGVVGFPESFHEMLAGLGAGARQLRGH